MFFKQDGSFNLKLIQLMLILTFLGNGSLQPAWAQEVTDSSSFEEELSFEVPETVREMVRQDILPEDELRNAADNVASFLQLMKIRYIELIFWLDSYDCFDRDPETEPTCNLIQKTMSDILQGINRLTVILLHAPLIVGSSLATRYMVNSFRVTTGRQILNIIKAGAVWGTALYAQNAILDVVAQLQGLPNQRKQELVEELRLARTALQVVDYPTLTQAMTVLGYVDAQEHESRLRSLHATVLSGGRP